MEVYFERRVAAARGSASLAADLMRHLHTRQHLGRTIIICDQPIAMLSACRKQWLKLSRSMQYQRSATLNVDKILKYTHSITRMQRMQFTSKDALDWSDADVYCLRLKDATHVPDDCYNVYLTIPIDVAEATVIASQLPKGALIIDYDRNGPWQELKLLPKTTIEHEVTEQWKAVKDFLHRYHIDTEKLFHGNVQDVQAMDNALDALLGISKTFMGIADAFHQTLALARPLRITKAQRMEYDSLSLLAHRVQALSPGDYSQRFLETYDEDDGMFLYDSSRAIAATANELYEMSHLHEAAGRFNLASALMTQYDALVLNSPRF